MDGLECSEIRFSHIKNDLLRLEAEFYQKKYLKLEESLSVYYNLGDMCNKIECGPFGSNLLDTEYKDSGILVLRPFNLKNCTIEKSNLVFVDDQTIKMNNLKKYPEGTLLFSRVGDIKVGVSDRYEITISPNIIAVTLKEDNISKYLGVFFKTNWGYMQIQRQLKVSAQPTISTNIISALKIPRFEHLETVIVKIFDMMQEKESKAYMTYQLCEELLLSHFGPINDLKTNAKVTVKSFSESFLSSGRLDAEYYQPKYDVLNEKLSCIHNDVLGNLVWITKSIEPGSDEYLDNGIPFLRVSDLSKYGLSEPSIHLSRVPFAHMSLQPKKDTILLSKDGSVGIAFKVEEDMDIVTSGAILHLTLKNPKELLPDYLTLVLNSVIVQMQAERDAGGSIIQHWKLTEIEQVQIPILDIEIQKEISEKVQESFALRRQSEQLLENVKRAIEMAIEDGEEKALAWLDETIKDILDFNSENVQSDANPLPHSSPCRPGTH